MAELKALLFDQDGVLADTERDGHRVAFNRTFKEFDLDTEWDVATYGELLKIGGGKERMRAWFQRQGIGRQGSDLDALIQSLHERKTVIFTEIIERGEILLRPGIKRMITEAHQAGIKLAVCSTSNEKAVRALVRTLLGGEIYRWFDLILAGDAVKIKKPDPAIYNLARAELGVEATDCVVIEDSQIGLTAATRAGMHCLVTVNGYTAHEDFAGARLVVSSLGDPEGPAAQVLGGRPGLTIAGFVNIEHIKILAKADL